MRFLLESHFFISENLRITFLNTFDGLMCISLSCTYPNNSRTLPNASECLDIKEKLEH